MSKSKLTKPHSRIVLLLGVGCVVAAFTAATDLAQAQQPQTAAQQKAEANRTKALVQAICPVSGNPLDPDNGKAHKVKIGQQELFVCCKGCMKGQVKPEHWAKIHENFARAQQICPIMESPLPKEPKWTIVNGQIVYVCCPPCTKKIHAKPDETAKMVTQLYRKHLMSR